MAKFDIIVGSVLGASEYVADALYDALTAQNHSATVHLKPNFADMAQDSVWLICSSTHGAGELPDNIQPFAQQLKEQDIGNTPFLVIGLGDSSYDTFCSASRTLEDLLTQANGQLLCPPLHIDVLVNPIPENIATQWLENILPTLNLPQ